MVGLESLNALDARYMKLDYCPKLEKKKKSNNFRTQWSFRPMVLLFKLVMKLEKEKE
jgi:hypothetical protein